MNRKTIGLFAVVAVMSSTTSAYAVDYAIEWLNFRASGLVADQTGGSSVSTTVLGSTTSDTSFSTYSGIIAWTPTLCLGKLDLRLNLGGSVLRNAALSRFFVADYQAVVAYDVTPAITLEAQGGAQTWTSGNGGTNGIVGGNVAYNLPKESFFNQIFAGYSRYFLTGNGVDEIRLGVGVQL